MAELRERLAEGAALGVIWLSLGAPALAELAAQAGADALVLDLQHGLWDRAGLEAAVGLAAPRCPVLVRVAENSARAIGEALDAGAEGVLVPLVETPEEAAAAVAAARYPPEGRRSGGGVRPLAAGFGPYVAHARARTLVGVMIETRAGVADAAGIAAVPGLDLVFLGTGDLMLSHADEPDPAGATEAACARVLAACRAAGLPCGAFTPDAAAAVARRAEGHALTVVASDLPEIMGAFAGAARRFNGAG